MSHTHGIANVQVQHFSPHPGLPVRFPRGPFISVLASTPRMRVLGEVPDRLFLALLTRAPNLDGVGFEEFLADDYSRQPVNVTKFNGDFDANENPLSFGLSAAVGLVTHVGLFNEAGALLFYGCLLSTRQSTAPEYSFEFGAYALKLKRLRSGSYERTRPH